jgi:hypothetical protein
MRTSTACFKKPSSSLSQNKKQKKRFSSDENLFF